MCFVQLNVITGVAVVSSHPVDDSNSNQYDYDY